MPDAVPLQDVTPATSPHKNADQKLVDSNGRTFDFGKNTVSHVASANPFLAVLGIAQVGCLILFGLFCDYEDPPDDAATAAAEFVYYNNVAIMMLVGFGFLMAFLKNYGLGSIGMTFLLTVIILQWTILLEGFWEGVYNNGKFHIIKIGMFDLISGHFAAATILISFGCLIGKISPVQMCLLGLLELLFYTFNFGITLKWLGVVDIGGSIAVHMFGAFFGLAAALVWGHTPTKEEESDESSTATSDTFSLIGTVFLWIFWPSFNGAPAAHGTAQQMRVTINTVLSLAACCTATFFSSRFLSKSHKFGPPDIQNATLAGGVAVGAAANMIIKPWGALAIGALGGILSTWGFRVAQPFLQNKIGLHDTCGVQNLHGWPSILGAIVSAVVAGFAKESDGYKDFDSVFPEGNRQAGHQMAGMVLTLLTALASGALCAFIVKMIMPKEIGGGFRDVKYWEVADKVV